MNLGIRGSNPFGRAADRAVVVAKRRLNVTPRSAIVLYIRPEAFAGQAWTRGLLIRRKIADGDLAFFTTWAPRGTTIERLAKIKGHRWAIEDSFETTKNELGLDHNETRSWHGWRRHVSLVMLGFAMMAAIRVHANKAALPPKAMRGKAKTLGRPGR